MSIADKLKAAMAFEFPDEIAKAGFDHPCKQTCSGWTQGQIRGAANENARLAPLIALVAELIAAGDEIIRWKNDATKPMPMLGRRVDALESALNRLREALDK